VDGEGAGAEVVFCEVKARRAGGRAGTAEEAVTRQKADRLARAANAFLARKPGLAGRSCRFDVVAIGLYRGEACYAPGSRPGRNPIGIAFVLADGKHPADRTRPEALHLRSGEYFAVN